MNPDDDWQGLHDDGDEHLRTVTEMLARWARTTLADLAAYRQACATAEEVHRRIEANYYDWEQQETRAWQSAYEDVYIAGFRLISAVFQQEKWYLRHRELRGLAGKVSDHLRIVRNVLEHLDEAEFDWDTAHKKTGVTRAESIDKLPDGQFPLGWRPSFTTNALGLVSLNSIEARAKNFRWYDELAEDRFFEPSDIDFDNMGYR